MDNKNDCPICGMKYNEPSISSPLAPSLCWLETTLKVNGVIQMKFGYGDDFEHIFYYPKYCPECGRKVKADQRLAFADQSGAEYADNPTV